MNIQKSFSRPILFVALICINYTSNVQAQPTVKIGTQTWMKQNLNVDKFRNGENIPQANTDEEWKKAGINKQAAWCYYNNDPANGAKYGKLYNWYAVNDPRGLAPVGWHVISWTGFQTFFTPFLPEAAGKLKQVGTLNWKTPNTGATNESGFTGLPGGFRSANGFFNLGEVGKWWASSGENDSNVWSFDLIYLNGRLNIASCNEELGLSVRCLKD
jgi:uncharacterized protein (TIGR02145 family)